MRALGLATCLLSVATAASSQLQMMNTGGGRPAVSADGRWIAYSAARNGEWEIFVVHPDGTGGRRITNVGERNFVNLGPPTWVGDRVLIWQRINDTTRAWLAEVANLPAVANTAPHSAPTSAAASAGSANPGVQVPFDAIQIRPSPDGRQLVYLHAHQQRSRLTVANIDGTGVHDVTDGSAPVANPDWSRDGKRIAFTVVDSASHGQIAVINADGSGYRVLTHLDPAEGLPQWANWAPDGKRLVIQAGKYNRTKIEESTAHLWLVDVDTGDATKLAPHVGYLLDETPAWLPDGKRIAFQSTRSGVMEVWIMNADGTNARSVTPFHS